MILKARTKYAIMSINFNALPHLQRTSTARLTTSSMLEMTMASLNSIPNTIHRQHILGGPSPRRQDLTEHPPFGRLVVQSMEWGSKVTYAICTCSCGQRVRVRAANLKSGLTRSCGCLQQETRSKSRRKDLTGTRFGRLLVLAMAWEDGHGKANCLCDCGKTLQVMTSGLLAQQPTQSCGCLQREITSRRSRKDVSGRRFGRLVAQSMIYGKGDTRVLCHCDCGASCVPLRDALISHHTQSCGCLFDEYIASTRVQEQEKRERRRLTEQRRRTREKCLPWKFNMQNFAFLMRYWKDACAICGREGEGLWHRLALDHWIPLTDPGCPGTVPWNLLLLCHGKKGAQHAMGTTACNNAKHCKDPVRWLIATLGQRKAQAKLQEIERYFAAARVFEESRHPTLQEVS
jgi:hypothetical protein